MDLTLSRPENALLLMVDFQGKLFDLAFNADTLRINAGKLVRIAELFGVPTVLTEQYPRGLGPTAPSVQQAFDGLTGEKHKLEKLHFGCCGEPAFNQLLARLASKVRKTRGLGDPADPVDVVVAGIESHVCVHQTVMELLQRDYRVMLLLDCIGSRKEAYHRMAVERFRQSGAVLTNLETLAFEWARTKEHPGFNKLSAIIKE